MTARKAAPSPQNFPAAAARALDNSEKAACCIPSRHRFVGLAVVRRSTHEPKDAYRQSPDCADLPPPEVALFLVWLESSAIQSGSNSLMTLSGPESRVVSGARQSPFPQPGDQRALTCAEPIAQDLPQTRFGKIALLFGRGFPVGRPEQDVPTLPYANECLHGRRPSDSCPTASAPDNGR